MNARDFLLAKALGKGSGVSLPTLSSPASASDIYQGTEAIDQAGAVVVGTNPYNAAVVDPIKASALTAIADKGVATTGEEALCEIPGLIDDIVTPNNQDKTITENGTYTADAGYTGLGTVTVDVASSGGDADTLTALIDRSIMEINGDLEKVGSYAFAGCTSLTTASFPTCKKINKYAFYQCSNLISANFPACSYISESAFVFCSNLATANFDVCKTVASGAFLNCQNLETIHFPQCITISTSAFFQCKKITTVNFPSCSIAGNDAFHSCAGITTASFPVCGNVGASCFAGCRALESVFFPICSNIAQSAFGNCYNLTKVDFPECKEIGWSAFYKCKHLQTAFFPTCKSINVNVFASCTALSALLLSGSSVCSLGASNTFNNTPIASGTGYIYVPSSLVDAYKSATNWTYFSNQISAIEDSEFA